MQSSLPGIRRELFTSFAGTGPLADILADLPLPSHLPTPIEQTVMGGAGLSEGARKVLNKTNPSLSAQVTQALLSVDCNFLQLKEESENRRYVPDSNAPPLVKAVMSNLFQPMVRVKKIDAGNYASPSKTQASVDATVPLQTLSESAVNSTTPQKTKKQKHKRPPHPSHAPAAPQHVVASSKSQRRRSSDSAESKAKKLKQNPLVVSINRTSIDAQKKLHPGSTMRVKKRRPLEAQDSFWKEQDRDGTKKKLTVQVPRSKLRGEFSSADREDNREMMHYEDVGDSFMLAGGMAADQVVPSDTLYAGQSKRKRKRKHSSTRGDPAKLANVKHYIGVMESVFDHEDQLASDDSLFNRAVIAQLVGETAKLKQQAILHEVPVESLVKLIGIMDKHVIDTAELQMNVLPEEVEAEPRVWRELARDRILRSVDASLVILHITTAPYMPKNVHLEESIEQVMALTKFHLDNNVYPAFDPVYRAENKESGVLPRQKRRYATGTANKDTLAVYHKLTEVVENLALLLETQPLTDTTVLQLSSLGVFPFFVENVSSLQLSALRLVRAIFSRYEKHRDLILEDIFASLTRLPTTKRKLRSFKLSNGQSIQMVTALILQLVQCIVVPPRPEDRQERGGAQGSAPSSRPDTPTGSESGEDSKKPDLDVQMTNSYELALRTGKNFLSTFLKKCSSSKDEDDFRPLFENFVQDLLTTLNLPKWPAAEVLLTLLGMLLVHSFSTRSKEQSLRLTSLEHMGVIAARLRKDASTSMEQDHEELINILSQILQSKLERKSTPSPTASLKLDAFSENTQHLQKALIAYLCRRSEGDPACAYARDFYIGQWLRDAQLDLEKALKGSLDPPDFPMDSLVLDQEAVPAISSSAIALQQAEVKKEVLHSFTDPKALASLKHLEGVLDERSAAVVTRFLASSRTLSRSFDMYLQQLLRVLNEPAVHVRTRAMKALSTIIAADPSILSRPDMQRAVQCRFMDQSTLVREAAVDLVGRFVLSRPELTSQYYEMLNERILDTGVSVRKRVIKILRDICVLQPEFPKVNEICIRIIRRITDEEGIKQLVTSVFRDLWFAPTPEGGDQKEKLIRRVTNITAVVGSCKEYEWFEQLLEQLLKSNDSAAVRSVMEVCQMTVDCLVENVLTLDETTATGPGSSSSHLVACITTLYLFCKIRPTLLLKHATTLHPYLSSKCSTQSDIMVLHYVAQVLKQVVPLMEHPSQAFLAGLEEDLVKLTMKHGQMIVQSCVGCLGAVVNQVTHNYTLVKDCFQKFLTCLQHVRSLHSQNPTNPQLSSLRASLLRSLFTVGLICKNFDIDSISSQPAQANPISKQVYSHLMYFSRHSDEEVQLKTATGLGFFCIRYPELMLEKEAKQFYQDWLTKDCSSKKKCQVLRNLQNHLKEVETKLKTADHEWSQKGDKENLQEFGDMHSSVSSNIAQSFLSPVLESFFHAELQVRLGALQAIILILRQGLVHPAQCVPYLIAMSTDSEQTVKVKADQQLSDHSSRYGHFMQSQLMAGVKKSFKFQQVTAGDVVRGCTDNATNPQSVLAHTYSLIRSNKQNRRAFLRALLRHFEDYEKNPLGLLLYLADNLAYFPYNTLEEPLFVVHHIDMTISVTGSSLLQAFKECLSEGSAALDDDEEDLQRLSQQSCDLRQLADCCHSCQGCFLLLLLKQHLKKTYGLSDSKCQSYSPNESNKTYEKAVSRKSGVLFEPQQVIEEVKSEAVGRRMFKPREQYLQRYLEFKQLMNRLDPFEGDDAGSDQENPPVVPPPMQPAGPEGPLQADGSDKPPASTGPTRPGPTPALVAPRAPSSRRSRSRASSTSSTASLRDRRASTIEREKPKKRRRVIVSSDDESDDPEFKA